jgi:hypothetical protein
MISTTTTLFGGRIETSTVDISPIPRPGVSTVDLIGPSVETADDRQPGVLGAVLHGAVAALGGWLCPAGANCWRVARRAGAAGLGLVPVELLIGAGAIQVRHALDGAAGGVHLSPAGAAMVTVASPLILAVTAGLTRWWDDERGWPKAEILTGAEAKAVLAAYHAQRAGRPEAVRDGG